MEKIIETKILIRKLMLNLHVHIELFIKDKLEEEEIKDIKTVHTVIRSALFSLFIGNLEKQGFEEIARQFEELFKKSFNVIAHNMDEIKSDH